MLRQRTQIGERHRSAEASALAVGEVVLLPMVPLAVGLLVVGVPGVLLSVVLIVVMLLGL